MIRFHARCVDILVCFCMQADSSDGHSKRFRNSSSTENRNCEQQICLYIYYIGMHNLYAKTAESSDVSE